MRLLVAVLALWAAPAFAHEWYTSQKNEAGQSCCGGYDCAGSAAWRVQYTGDGYDVWIQPGSHPSVPANDTQECQSYSYSEKPICSTRSGFGSEPVKFHFKGNPGISPDGQIHACITRYDATQRNIRCLFIGGNT